MRYVLCRCIFAIASWHCAILSVLVILSVLLDYVYVCNVRDLVCGVMSGLLQQPLSQHAVEVRQCSLDARDPPIHLEFLRLSTPQYRDQPARHANAGPRPQVGFGSAILLCGSKSPSDVPVARFMSQACASSLPASASGLRATPVAPCSIAAPAWLPCQVPDGWHLANPT